MVSVVRTCELSIEHVCVILLFVACKQKETEIVKPRERTPKKPRLVFTDIQRRTLHAIFKETKRPSKEMQATIAKQAGPWADHSSQFLYECQTTLPQV